MESLGDPYWPFLRRPVLPVLGEIPRKFRPKLNFSMQNPTFCTRKFRVLVLVASFRFGVLLFWGVCFASSCQIRSKNPFPESNKTRFPSQKIASTSKNYIPTLEKSTLNSGQSDFQLRKAQRVHHVCRGVTPPRREWARCVFCVSQAAFL